MPNYNQQIDQLYMDAIVKIDPGWEPTYEETHDLRSILLEYSRATRQTKEARIARKALKDASYAYITG